MTTDLGQSTNVKIGSSQNTVEDVKIEPHVEFQPGIGVQKNLSGQDRYVGGPRCRWTYPNRLLSGEQFYQLRNLLGNSPSATVYIDVPTQTIDTDDYTPQVATYRAIMHWPEEGVTRINMNRWQIPDEGILFTRLVGQ